MPRRHYISICFSGFGSSNMRDLSELSYTYPRYSCLFAREGHISDVPMHYKGLHYTTLTSKYLPRDANLLSLTKVPRRSLCWFLLKIVGAEIYYYPKRPINMSSACLPVPTILPLLQPTLISERQNIHPGSERPPIHPCVCHVELLVVALPRYCTIRP